MGEIIIEFTDEKIINYSGLKIVKDVLDTTNFKKRVDSIKKHGNSSKISEIFYNAISFQCLGKSNFDYVNEFRKDEAYKIIMEFDKIVPESTYRQNLDKIGKNYENIILEENVNILKNNSAKLTSCYKDYCPLDLDVTPMDNSGSQKEGVSWTYKKYMGYAPMMAYLGEEGYLINTELREGSQHSQKGTKEFLSKTIELSRIIHDGKILLRMDSGNDAIDNVVICEESKNPVDYLIKRNLRKESKEEWLKTAKEFNEEIIETPEKNHYYGIKIVKRKVKINGIEVEREFKIAYHVKEIKVLKKQILLIPKIEVDTYWTSLDIEAEEVVKLYNNHGTSEQFHSEIKSDMNIEKLPSGKFDTNYLMLQLGMMAYNILRLIGQKTLDDNDSPLKTKVERRRIRTIMQNIMYFASKIVKHARKIFMKISRNSAWSITFKRVGESFFPSSA